MEDDHRGDSLERFERRTALPMLVLSLAIVPLLVVPLVFDLSLAAETALVAVDWMLWSAFAVEYVVRLVLAADRRSFVKTNKLDLVVVVLPFLRPLRVARSARALRLLHAARAATALGRALDAGRDVMTRHSLHYALLLTSGIVVAAAGLVQAVEHGAADANIETFGDALWWAVSTVTTVGYGDAFPITAAGRAIGVVLMVVGVSVFGLLAASLSSYFVERRQRARVDPRLDEIVARLRRMEEALAERPKDD